MDRAEITEILSEARAIAADAATLVLGGFRRAPASAAKKKGVIDLVTAQDLASEALLRERIGRAFPDHLLVAEEGTAPEVSAARDDELVWWVDPLDGTTNYAHGHPFFAVSLGLARGRMPLVGVVAAPALGVTWSGALGLGAFRNGDRCRVSSTDALGDALLATGFPYDRRTAADDNLREFAVLKKHHAQGIRRCGSASIDLALVADGTYDGYWEQRLMPWDMAAGALLVAEAGGRLSDYDGTLGDPRAGRLVATNGRIHDALLAALGAVRNKP
jgi:myo-inositol-1(or 4)-monophosphatase